MKRIPQMSPKGKAQTLLVELFEASRPGCCLVCDGRLPDRPKGRPGRRAYVHAECRRDYYNLYRNACRASKEREVNDRLVHCVRHAWAKLDASIVAMEREL